MLRRRPLVFFSNSCARFRKEASVDWDEFMCDRDTDMILQLLYSWSDERQTTACVTKTQNVYKQ